MDKNILKMIVENPINKYIIEDKCIVVNDNTFIPINLYDNMKKIYANTYGDKISNIITGDVFLFINTYELFYFNKNYIVGLIKRLNYSGLKPTIIIDKIIPKVHRSLIEEIGDSNYEMYYYHSDLSMDNSTDIIRYRKDTIIKLTEMYNKKFIISSYADIVVSNELYDFNMYLYLKNINGAITDPVDFSYNTHGMNEYFFNKMFNTDIMKNVTLLSDEKIILSDYLIKKSSIYDYYMLDTYNDNNTNLVVLNYDSKNIDKMKKIFEIADIVGFNIIIYYGKANKEIVKNNVEKISGNYSKCKFVGKDNFYNIICSVNNKSIIIDPTRDYSLIKLLVENYSLENSLSYLTIEGINDCNKYNSIDLEATTILLLKKIISTSYVIPDIKYEPVDIKEILS